MSDELKPCPFCGGEAVFNAHATAEDIGNGMVCRTLAVIECPRCEFCIAHETDEEAVAAWNARAERTCRWVPFDEGHSIAGPGWRCSECGLELGPENVFVVERCYCCPGCCSKVVG